MNYRVIKSTLKSLRGMITDDVPERGGSLHDMFTVYANLEAFFDFR
jgi:hypothetical protein